MPALLVTAGCFRPVRDAPVDPGFIWTTFQGSADRHPFAEERVPQRTPETVWNVNTGRGLSAPPVPLGPVLVATTTNRMVITLSSETGSIYWEHRKNGPFVTPAVTDGERLYLATSDVSARVYALRRIDGGEEWEKRLPGLSAPMILDGERLYLATEPGAVMALRSRDGERIWQASLGAPTAAAPVILDGRLLVPSIRDTLYTVSLDDGSIDGKRPLSARVSAPPAVRGTGVFLPLQSGHVLHLDAADLSERWRARVGGPVLAAPVATEDGRLYVLSRDGSVWTVSPAGEPHRLRDLGSAATGALTVTANAVVVGLLDGRVVALAREDGAELWTVDLGDSVNTPPVVQDGALFVPLRRGRVVKLR